MKKPDCTMWPCQSIAVDQLSNTLALMSCGILDFTLLNPQDDDNSNQDLRLNFLEITHSLEQARNLLNIFPDVGPLLQKKETIAQIIDDIATQTNLLAINVAFHATFAGLFPGEFSLVTSQLNGLASRACVTTMQILKLIEAGSRTSLPEAWQTSWNKTYSSHPPTAEADRFFSIL